MRVKYEESSETEAKSRKVGWAVVVGESVAELHEIQAV